MKKITVKRKKKKPASKKSTLKKNWREMRNAFKSGEPEKKLKKYGKLYAQFKGL